MRKAINILAVVAVLLLFLGLESYSMGTSLGWNPYRVAGIYICVGSLIFGLISVALYLVNWIRKNVKIQ